MFKRKNRQTTMPMFKVFIVSKADSTNRQTLTFYDRATMNRTLAKYPWTEYTRIVDVIA